ncbi:cupin domain-containing protein [Neorhizobium lilium]|uniref:Cupin domain-containing protein n=1 Tax=Neorhizobium lilium TaxID=2503024 RepID=A0A3S4UIQ8_9HYPH|nr:cupin domain-containing protein [Neorhizobium lilium]RWX74764.1 cupin domain-containing protein [Neorhizobium lilium]
MSGHAGAEPSVRPATIVTPIACTPLPDIAGKSITTAVVHFPPNAYTPKHRHPGSVTAYVLSGTIQSQIAGESAETYSAGQTWFEPTGAVHSFAHNISFTEDADLLAIFVADTNCGPLTIFD